jgi:hypothetical protein
MVGFIYGKMVCLCPALFAQVGDYVESRGGFRFLPEQADRLSCALQVMPFPPMPHSVTFFSGVLVEPEVDGLKRLTELCNGILAMLLERGHGCLDFLFIASGMCAGWSRRKH